MFFEARDPHGANVPDSGLTLETGSLEQYQWEGRRYPRLVDQEKLARSRLADGDSLYFLKQDNQLCSLAWAGSRNMLAATYELGEGFSKALPQPVTVIYDCWTPEASRGRGYYPAMLGMLRRKYQANSETIWIYCLDTNIASRRGIEKAGFVERFAVTRYRCFHWLVLYSERSL